MAIASYVESGRRSSGEGAAMIVRAFVRRHPLLTYFAAAYATSWGAFAVVDGPKLLRGAALRPTDALLMFPMLIVAVAIAGSALTAVVEGRAGLRDLSARMRRWRVGARWYAVLLLPPGLVLAVLLSFRTLVSPAFTPNFFALGILFGLAPGFLEEIGWTGYAFPRLQAKSGPLAAGILLGVLWGLWHMPVVDALGAAAPHGSYWLPFFLAFIALVAAMRVLIVWVYANTRSVLLAQLLHASSTGSLVVLGAAHASPAQEALWYAAYAACLWVVVAIVARAYGPRLTRRPSRIGEASVPTSA